MQEGHKQPVSNSGCGALYSSSTPVSPQRFVDNLLIAIISEPLIPSVKFEDSLRL